jgi:hypothetical protein
VTKRYWVLVVVFLIGGGTFWTGRATSPEAVPELPTGTVEALARQALAMEGILTTLEKMESTRVIRLLHRRS